MGRRRNANRKAKKMAQTVLPKTTYVYQPSPPVQVFRVGSAEVFAASGSDIKAKNDWAMVLCCAGSSSLPVRDVADIVVSLDWGDGGVPDLDRKRWQVIVDMIAVQHGKVGVYCVGGHGRTGTALSIIAGLAGLTQSDPVAFVRKAYREKAVETKKQIEYVEEITGIKVEVGESDPYGLELGGYGVFYDLDDYRDPFGFKYTKPGGYTVTSAGVTESPSVLKSAANLVKKITASTSMFRDLPNNTKPIYGEFAPGRCPIRNSNMEVVAWKDWEEGDPWAWCPDNPDGLLQYEDQLHVMYGNRRGDRVPIVNLTGDIKAWRDREPGEEDVDFVTE